MGHRTIVAIDQPVDIKIPRALNPKAPSVAKRRSADRRERILSALETLEGVATYAELSALDNFRPSLIGFKRFARIGNDAFRGPNSDLRSAVDHQLERLKILNLPSTSSVSRPRPSKSRSRTARALTKLRQQVAELKLLIGANDTENLRMIYLVEMARKDT